MEVRPLAVLAAEKVVEHMLEDKGKKLAPHHVALINSTGIKRGKTEGKDETRSTILRTQKKARRDE